MYLYNIFDVYLLLFLTVLDLLSSLNSGAFVLSYCSKQVFKLSGNKLTFGIKLLLTMFVCICMNLLAYESVSNLTCSIWFDFSI